MIYEELTAAHLREWGRDVAGVSNARLKKQAAHCLAYALRGDDGALIAIGGVRWNEGRCWAWFDMRKRSIWVHRIARELFAALGAAGEREVWAEADEAIPGAARWLLRLGFEPCGGVWRLGLGGTGAVDRIDAASGGRPSAAGLCG